MEFLQNMIPESALFWVLFALSAIRFGIKLTSDVIAGTPGKEDDEKWKAIRTTWWFLLIERVAYYALGIVMPKK